MKNLENIPKKNIYEVPEGYFETLPGIIQSRIAKETGESRPFMRYSVRFALPAVVLTAVVYFFLWNSDRQPSSPEEMLASIETPYLLEYLDENAMTEDDLFENTALTEKD